MEASSDPAPAPQEAPKDSPPSEAQSKKSPWDRAPAIISALSLLLNVVLLIDKFTQEKMEQPSPSIWRLEVAALHTSIWSILETTKDKLGKEIPEPRIVQSASWLAERDRDKTLSMIELRERHHWFLVFHSPAKVEYSHLTLNYASGLPLELGSLSPDTTILVYYDSEDALNQATLTYSLAGSSSKKQTSIPVRTGSGLEIIGGIDNATLTRYGALNLEDDRLNELLQIAQRSKGD